MLSKIQKKKLVPLFYSKFLLLERWLNLAHPGPASQQATGTLSPRQIWFSYTLSSWFRYSCNPLLKSLFPHGFLLPITKVGSFNMLSLCNTVCWWWWFHIHPGASGVFISKESSLPLVFPFLIIAATIPAFGMKHKTALLTIRSDPTFYSLVFFVLLPLGQGIKEITCSNIYTHGLSIRKIQLNVWWEFLLFNRIWKVQMKNNSLR